MATETTTYNQEKYWVDGDPFQGMKNNLLFDTGTEKYWADGNPVQFIYSKSNYDTGKMFFIFDE